MKMLIGIAAALAITLLAANVLADAPITASANVQCNQNSDCATTTLSLCTKDTTTWQCINGPNGILTFNQSGLPSTWHLTTTGLDANTQYALIYYPDKAERFNSWNGAGGMVIKIFNGSANNLQFNPPAGDLPIVGDWNIAPSPDYCDKHNTFDSYAHCTGAKLWIVSTSDLTSDTSLPLVNWNPGAWLFETDLINYSTNLVSTCQDHQCTLVPKACGISAGPVGFGNIVQGTTTDGTVYSRVSNSGNTAANLGISGTDWTPYMPVGQTSWSVSGSGGTFYALTKIDTSTGASVPASPGTQDVNLKLTVPSGQATGTYSQTITFTGSC